MESYLQNHINSGSSVSVIAFCLDILTHIQQNHLLNSYFWTHLIILYFLVTSHPLHQSQVTCVSIEKALWFAMSKIHPAVPTTRSTPHLSDCISCWQMYLWHKHDFDRSVLGQGKGIHRSAVQVHEKIQHSWARGNKEVHDRCSFLIWMIESALIIYASDLPQPTNPKELLSIFTCALDKRIKRHLYRRLLLKDTINNISEKLDKEIDKAMQRCILLRCRQIVSNHHSPFPNTCSFNV